MDLNEIMQLVGNGFFPIVCSALLFKLFFDMKTTLSDLNTTLQLMNERIENIENKLKDKEN